MNKRYINRLVDSVVEPIPNARARQDGLPYATHMGMLRIGSMELRCYVLNTGQRIFDADHLLAKLAAEP